MRAQVFGFALLLMIIVGQIYPHLPPNDQYFLSFYGGMGITLCLLASLLPKKVQEPHFPLRNKRLILFYKEYLKIHHRKKSLKRIYWILLLVTTATTWALYLMRYFNFDRPQSVVICFSSNLLISIFLLHRMRRIDDHLILTTLKGLRVEKNLAITSKYFDGFARRKEILITILHVSPLLFTLYPLLNSGLGPLMFSESHAKWGFWVVISLTTIAFVVMSLLPYRKILRYIRS